MLGKASVTDFDTAWVAQTGGGGTTTDASALTSGTLAVARIADGSLTAAKMAADVATQAELDTASTADRARANHTGTQTSASISDLTEAVQDIVGAFFGAGTGASVTYDDAANTITVSATGTTDPEAVRDAIGAAMVGVGNISVTVNDALDTITISTTATVNSTDAALRDRSTHTGTQAASTVTGLATVATTGVYGDLTGKPTIPAALTVQDETVALTQRAAINFVGAGVTATDDAANGRTVVTIPGGAGGASPGWYGDGSDGDATISAATTLTRDMHYNNLTVAASGVINATGYRVFVKGDCAIDAAGVIHNDGANANNNAGGTGGSSAANQRALGRGASGASNAASATTAGNAAVTPNGAVFTDNSLGGNGGNGGAGSSAAGGAGLAVTRLNWTTTATRALNGWRMLPARILGYIFSQVNDAPANGQMVTGGGGGGAGGPDGTGTGTNVGGGGGGGGVLVLAARRIANNGRISANGGNGGNAGNGGATNAGGGGGGGGGVVLVTCDSYSGTGVTSANGGTGGSGLGTGATGSAGTAGTVSIMTLGG